MFLFSPGQDASQSKGYPLAPLPLPPLPPQYILRYPFIHLGVVKHYDSEVSAQERNKVTPAKRAPGPFQYGVKTLTTESQRLPYIT